MYNLGQLFRLTRAGFADLWPALRAAFNADKSDDQLDSVYGTRPRHRIIVLTIALMIAGECFDRFGPVFPLKEYVNWSAVVIAIAFALILRRYLFASGKAGELDFPWLAASLVPAIALCALVGALTYGTGNGSGSLFLNARVELGGLLLAVTNGLGIAAALTISIATLCFSRDWIKASIDLATRLFVFRVMVWVTALIMFEVRIVGEVLMPIVARFVGLSVPPWLSDLADQISYAGFLSLAYLAIIGTTWTVCKSSFAQLLRDGQVDILEAVAASAEQSRKPSKSD